jgi:hypothetical protein
MLGVAETIHQIEQMGIKVYEAGGEVWYDIPRALSQEENIKLGLLSGRVQKSKQLFVEHLWRRDWENSENKRFGKTIIDRMVGKKSAYI